MTFLWDTATQLDQRVRINEQKRTVDRGALWLEESLPAETLLIGLMEADRCRKAEMSMPPEEVLDFALQKPVGAAETVLQFGGKATTGRGRCRSHEEVAHADQGPGAGTPRVRPSGRVVGRLRLPAG